jgi:hypothetical protein
MRPLSECIIGLSIVNIGVGPEDYDRITGKGHSRCKRPPPIIVHRHPLVAEAQSELRRGSRNDNVADIP